LVQLGDTTYLTKGDIPISHGEPTSKKVLYIYIRSHHGIAGIYSRHRYIYTGVSGNTENCSSTENIVDICVFLEKICGLFNFYRKTVDAIIFFGLIFLILALFRVEMRNISFVSIPEAYCFKDYIVSFFFRIQNATQKVMAFFLYIH